MTVPVILDCDPGNDDAIAILLTLASPEVELLGITTVAGNAGLNDTTANALRVLEVAGRTDIPVASGADRPLLRVGVPAPQIHGDRGMGGPQLPEPATEPVRQHAVDFIADRIADQHLAVTLVAVGPLTNVALLLACYPSINLERIIVMGGAIGLGNITPAAESNIWRDPEAARRVFESGLDVTMIGLDVTLRALLGPSHSEALRSAGRCGQFVADLLDFYMKRYRQLYKLQGAPIHDAAAVAHLLKPGLVTTGRYHVSVETNSELCRGRTVVDRWAVTGLEPNLWVGEDIDAEAFARLLIGRIGSLP